MDLLKNKLLKDGQFVLDEVSKLQVFYKLKQVIRYHHTREEVVDTESTAEHIYGMMILARYFLPLEDPNGSWNENKINDFILYHDLDEIETGDTIDYLKNEHTLEAEATKRVIEELPESQQKYLTGLMAEYAKQESMEAKFVKAIDKFEPLIHLTHIRGKEIMLSRGTTLRQHWSIKREPFKPFPIISRFAEIITEKMKREEYFTPESKTLETKT